MRSCGVGEQAVAVEPLDVVALERRAVAPDVDAVLVHRADQHGAGDGAAERRGVEVGAAAGADVERAAGQRGEALLDELGAAVDGAGDLGAVLHAPGRGRPSMSGSSYWPMSRGVGARHGALVAHPGDGDGGVEAAGERDADALADGQGGQDLAHRGFLLVGADRGAVGCGARGRTGARVAGERQEPLGQGGSAVGSSADHQHGVVAGDGAEDVVELGPVERGGQELRGARRGAQQRQVGRTRRPRPAARRAAGPAGSRRPPTRLRRAGCGRRPRRARRRRARRRRAGP